jgi:hypothetical protein
MSNKNKTSDHTLYQALKQHGLIVPDKEEDVDAFEEAISHLDIPPLPKHLENPSDFMDKPYSRPQKILSTLVQQDSFNLARAARDGKKIPSSVLEKMRKDRDNAQKKDEF